MVNRRKFLLGSLGAVLAGSRLLGKKQELPPIEPQPREGRRKIALIYSSIDVRMHEAGFKATSLASGAAAGSVAGNLLYARQGKYTRQEFLDALPDLLAAPALIALTSSVVDVHDELSAEREALEKLHDDLQAKGYLTFTTQKGSEFIRLLQQASKDRPEDAKTVLFIDAHGAGDSHDFDLETNEPLVGRVGTFRIHSQSLARAIGEIPGHTFLGLGACHAHSKEFLNYPGFKSKLTLVTNNLGNWRNWAYGISPFFRSIRQALRRPGGLAEGALAAYYRHNPSFVAGLFRRLITFGMRSERINHDEPFIP